MLIDKGLPAFSRDIKQVNPPVPFSLKEAKWAKDTSNVISQVPVFQLPPKPNFDPAGLHKSKIYDAPMKPIPLLRRPIEKTATPILLGADAAQVMAERVGSLSGEELTRSVYTDNNGDTWQFSPLNMQFTLLGKASDFKANDTEGGWLLRLDAPPEPAISSMFSGTTRDKFTKRAVQITSQPPLFHGIPVKKLKM